jgi:hypothetical protein
MNEIDNEDLVAAFESVVQVFSLEIKPYALDICNHLKNMYQRCIAAGDDNGESGTIMSIKRILDAVQEDIPLMQQVEHIIYPVLLHTLTVDGFDSIEEGMDCITFLIYYAYKQTSISANMWKLYP